MSLAYRVEESIASDKAEMGESTLPLELFFFFFSFRNPKDAGVNRRNAVNGKGCKGEEDQTRAAGQYLRQHYRTKRKFHNRFFELSEASAVEPKRTITGRQADREAKTETERK